MIASYQLKPEQDGMGFYYGSMVCGKTRHHVNLLPPRTYAHAWFVTKDRTHMDPGLWRIFIDGEFITLASSREGAERALRDWSPT
ncbi:MAG TPA: hypothetical protein VH519_05570 [Hyphomicrobiaceae bacterium]|jgi:hypothetical protein